MSKLPKNFLARMKLPIHYDTSSRAKRCEARYEYVRVQNGLCYYCKKSLKRKPPNSVTMKKITLRIYPPNFFKYPVHLHHCHRTGMTLGAVHAYCNAVLYEYEGE